MATTVPKTVLGRDFSAPQRNPDPARKVHDDRFKKYLIGNTPLERIHVGSYWAEGPAWNAVGRYVVYSDIPKNRQLRWNEVTDEVTLFRKPSNYSNGNTFDFQGRQWPAPNDPATRYVTREEAWAEGGRGWRPSVA